MIMDITKEIEYRIAKQRHMMEFIVKLEALINEMPPCLEVHNIDSDLNQFSQIESRLEEVQTDIEIIMKSNRQWLQNHGVKIGY